MNLRIAIILFLVLAGGSLTVGSALGQGGTGRVPTPSPSPSTKQPAKSSQPVKKSTTSSKSSRSTSSKPNMDTSTTSSATTSLEETLKFINDTVDAHPANKMVSSLSRLSGCEVRITVDLSSDRTPGDYTKYTFSLTDMNPQSIKIFENQAEEVYTINMNTTGSKGNVKHEENRLGKYGLSEGHGTSLTVSNKESATRISNALSHAIKLCGGKPDPF